MMFRFKHNLKFWKLHLIIQNNLIIQLDVIFSLKNSIVLQINKYDKK